MKYYVSFGLLGSIVALAALAYNSTSFNQDQKDQNVTVKAATVSGNITDKRLNANDQLVVANKSILKKTVSKDRVIYLNDQVTYDSAQYVTNQIKELQSKSSAPIWLLIDSPGGSVLDGATIISEMEASKAPVNTVCTRLCASMAAMIHSYGAKRYALDRAILMYHPASAGASGQVPNMLSQLTTITRYVDKMVANVVNRSKVSKAEFEKLVAYELWIDAEDANAKGLNDGTVNLSVSSAPSGLSLAPAPQERQRRHNKTKSTFQVEMISPNLHLWPNYVDKD